VKVLVSAYLVENTAQHADQSGGTTTPANQALVDSWRLSLHDKQPRTFKLYVEEVTRFADERGADLSTVERRDVEKWFTGLRERELSSSLLRSRWIALRSFYAWATDGEEIGANPMLKIKAARPDPPAPDAPDAEALGKLLKVCQGSDFIHRRDLALIRLLAPLDSGRRRWCGSLSPTSTSPTGC
jgi:site-specific recombinase XerD